MRIPFGSGIDGTAKVLPCPKPGNAGCSGHLPRNLQHIPKAVVVKAAHGGEVVGEGVGVSGLQLLNQELDVGGDEFLFGVGFLAVDGGGGCGGHGGFSLVLAAALSALKRGMYMPNATWRRRG
jgi:hypothetical protein